MDDNTVLVDSIENGIIVWWNFRGNDPARAARGNYVHHNQVYSAMGKTAAAISCDPRDSVTSFYVTYGNRFDWNHYHVIGSTTPWSRQGEKCTFSKWQSYGYDINGTLDSNMTPSTAIAIRARNPAIPGNGKRTVSVYRLNGSYVKTNEVGVGEYAHLFSSIPAGIYLARICDGKNVFIGRAIIGKQLNLSTPQ